ncbi:hypothetical protein ABPG77_004886 [Micractinium sp. CCAP 211/92]
MDNGTGFVKAGFAGDDFPRCFPCMVGRPLPGGGGELKPVYVGAEAAANKQQLYISYPINNGIVDSWEDMELIWGHSFQDVLGVDPTTGCRIMLTEPPMNPKSNRQRMLETMFEHFGFEAAYVQVQAVLTLYACGALTGLVLDSGDGVTHAVPVVDGYSSRHLTRRLDVAGRHITAYLAELLTRRGYSFNRSADFDTVRQIKEKLCYMAFDFREEARLARETTCTTESFTLPDGRVIRLGAERFTAPEALMNPSLLGVEAPGLAEMVHNCIQDSDIDNRLKLYSNIVLSGGSTMYAGIASRLDKELRNLYLHRVLRGDKDGLRRLKLRVEDPPRRRHMVFAGAAVLADIMRGQDEFWIGRHEWAEDPHRAMAKCSGLGPS